MQLKSIESGDENNINLTNLPTTNSGMEVFESTIPVSAQLKTHPTEQEDENISNGLQSPADDLKEIPKSPVNAECDSDTETNYKSLSNKKIKSSLILEDSDEEETLEPEETSSNNEEVSDKLEATVGNHKRIAVLDSDSDSEDSSAITSHNKSFTKNQNGGISNGEPLVYTTNLRGEIVPEDQQPKVSQKRLKYTAIYYRKTVRSIPISENLVIYQSQQCFMYNVIYMYITVFKIFTILCGI